MNYLKISNGLLNIFVKRWESSNFSNYFFELSQDKSISIHLFWNFVLFHRKFLASGPRCKRAENYFQVCLENWKSHEEKSWQLIVHHVSLLSQQILISIAGPVDRNITFLCVRLGHKSIHSQRHKNSPCYRHKKNSVTNIRIVTLKDNRTTTLNQKRTGTATDRSYF